MEQNVLIAEFMRQKTVDNICEYCKEDVTVKPICNGDKKGNTRSHVLGGWLVPLHYHSSWSWLMPVVEKISRIKIEWENATDTDTYYPRTFGMLQEDTGLPMVRINGNSLFVGATLIEATYLAVVDFIEWHNQNK